MCCREWAMQANKLRVFIGVALDDLCNRTLSAVVAPLKAADKQQCVRWLSPANRHLTLVFLGDLNSEQLGRLQLQLQKTLTQQPTCRLELDQLARFPDARSAVVAALFSEAEAVLSLQQALRQLCLELELRLDDRPYRPHITLGRLRRGCEYDFPPQLLSGYFPVTRVTLFQSLLSAEGSQYRELFSVDLAES